MELESLMNWYDHPVDISKPWLASQKISEHAATIFVDECFLEHIAESDAEIKTASTCTCSSLVVCVVHPMHDCRGVLSLMSVRQGCGTSHVEILVQRCCDPICLHDVLCQLLRAHVVDPMIMEAVEFANGGGAVDTRCFPRPSSWSHTNWKLCKIAIHSSDFMCHAQWHQQHVLLAYEEFYFFHELVIFGAWLV